MKDCDQWFCSALTAEHSLLANSCLCTNCCRIQAKTYYTKDYKQTATRPEDNSDPIPSANCRVENDSALFPNCFEALLVSER